MVSPDPLLRSPTPEEIQAYLSAYDNIELLAVGGMGAIYKARQVSLDRTVAIKVLTYSCSLSLQFRKLIKEEAKVMAKLSHPSIVSIYDYGEINGMLYIVMQFVEGQSLFQISHGKQVAHQEAAQLILNIAEALSKAHRAGILHRDIKPANIIINSQATPVLIDFGLSHHTEETTLKGESIFGTDGYTAPEIQTPPYKADARSDLFALGVLFYELLTGAPPKNEYQPPSSLTKVDKRYDEFILRVINPEPDARPADAKTFISELNNILSKTPIELDPSHEEEQSNKHASIIPDSYRHETKTITKQQERVIAKKNSPKKTPSILVILTIIGIAISLGTIGVAYKKNKEQEKHYPRTQTQLPIK